MSEEYNIPVFDKIVFDEGQFEERKREIYNSILPQATPRQNGKNSLLREQLFPNMARGMRLPDQRMVVDFDDRRELVRLNDGTRMTYEELQKFMLFGERYPRERPLKKPNDAAALQVLVRYARQATA